MGDIALAPDHRSAQPNPRCALVHAPMQVQLQGLSFSAYLLRVPADAPGVAEPGLGPAGEVFELQGRDLPGWATHLVASLMSANVGSGDGPGDGPAADSGRVVVTAWCEGGRQLRQSTFLTPRQVAARLVCAKEQGQIPASRLPAAGAMLAWCRDETRGGAAAEN